MMKIKLTGLLTLVLLIGACSSSDSEPTTPTTNLNFGTISVSDVENKGNAADILINYAINGGDVSAIKEVRVLASKSSMTLESLLQVASPNYGLLSVSAAKEVLLAASLRDTEGNLVEEDQNYNIYLLGVFKDASIDPILSSAVSLKLNNEILVTTPQLTGVFNAQEDIVIANDGTLYVNEIASGSIIYKVTPEGESSIFSGALEGPVGIALDADENIYASNFQGTTIKKITPDRVVSDVVTDSKLFGGGGVALDNDGNIYNTFAASTTLFKISQGVLEDFVTSTKFDRPIGIAYDKERGKLYVANFGNGKILNVDESGTITEVADTPANIGHMSYANDHFYVTGFNQHKIYKVSLDGTIVEEIGTTNVHKDGTVDVAGFTFPNGIEATPDGRYVYVTERGGKLRKIIMKR